MANFTTSKWSCGIVMFLQLSVCLKGCIPACIGQVGVYPSMHFSRCVCIPTCTLSGGCVSQHALGQVGVYPSMYLSRWVCIPAYTWAGGCVSQHALCQVGGYPSMHFIRWVGIPAYTWAGEYQYVLTQVWMGRCGERVYWQGSANN